MKKTITIICFSILVVLSGVILMQKKEDTKNNIFRFALGTDVSTLHFASSVKGSIVNSSHVIQLLFEGLMRKFEDDLPRIAAAYHIDVSDDGKKYTFYLRDCLWSDGMPVTAHDFEYAWKRAIDPNSDACSTASYYYTCIKNAQRCLKGECSVDDLGIHAVDDVVLIVDLEYPTSYFLDALASPLFFPAPSHIAEKDPHWASKPGLVCNGPFLLDQWEHNAKLSLVKNPSYWDKDSVYLDGVDISIVPDTQTAVQMFEKGELDWVGDPFIQLPHDFQSTDFPDHYQEQEGTTMCWINLNIEKFPFNNKKFRQALGYALNRREIAHNLFNHAVTPYQAMVPSLLKLNAHAYFQDDHQTRARHLFKEALEELGLSKEELPQIELLFPSTSSFMHLLAQSFQSQWRNILGIDTVCLRPLPHNACINQLIQGKYDMGFANWSCFIFDPTAILNAFKNREDVINITNWEHAEFKSLIDASYEAALDYNAREDKLTRAEAILMEEMPAIPVCAFKKRFMKNPELKGEALSYLQSLDVKSAYFVDHP